ncbi:Uncharacterized protein APZ42_030294 [Daphnia magna]|uniref:Uncharacterized protein n=1 Tax=Daphnia magna TaxID=35525 RepID=A0A164NWZ9_9CRUS|nr:Uncharacterized protein APZ42_030294 [Daphnia magna]
MLLIIGCLTSHKAAKMVIMLTVDWLTGDGPMAAEMVVVNGWHHKEEGHFTVFKWHASTKLQHSTVITNSARSEWRYPSLQNMWH